MPPRRLSCLIHSGDCDTTAPADHGRHVGRLGRPPKAPVRQSAVAQMLRRSRGARFHSHNLPPRMQGGVGRMLPTRLKFTFLVVITCSARRQVMNTLRSDLGAISSP